ncbi:MAG: hypothetical protein U0J65_00490 [Christensenellales bacterium]|nr:hypothetical protein [Christensenellales bacterium]
MGTLADSLFTVLMGWVRALVNALWALFSADHTTTLEFLGKHWLLIAGGLIAAGLVIDWIIWLLRWQPYHLWAQRARRVLRIEEPEVQEEAEKGRARAAAMPQKRAMQPAQRAPQTFEEAPLYIDEREAELVMERAQEAPDERVYPGMRYGSEASADLESTQRYGAVTQEGPGAAEVARRRAEIDAWQAQMQEEARARAEAEQARRAQEAYEAEQARLAQEQYERELAEYERQKAQYERDLAEYERQKAAYDAQQRQEQAAELPPEELSPAELSPAELSPEAEMHTARRRRGAAHPAAAPTYSDYVQGEGVAELPDAPQWPQMPTEQAAHRKAAGKAAGKLLGRMAKMIEPEEEELAVRTKLPPRVDVKDAYKPAAAPAKPGRRKR